MVDAQIFADAIKERVKNSEPVNLIHIYNSKKRFKTFYRLVQKLRRIFNKFSIFMVKLDHSLKITIGGYYFLSTKSLWTKTKRERSKNLRVRRTELSPLDQVIFVVNKK